jgi:hypothetical protein
MRHIAQLVGERRGGSLIVQLHGVAV